MCFDSFTLVCDVQVHKAFDYLSKSTDVDTPDVRYEVSVKRSDSAVSQRGVYARGDVDTATAMTYNVTLTPKLHSDADVKSEKLQIENKLSLRLKVPTLISNTWHACHSRQHFMHQRRCFACLFQSRCATQETLNDFASFCRPSQSGLMPQRACSCPTTADSLTSTWMQASCPLACTMTSSRRGTLQQSGGGRWHVCQSLCASPLCCRQQQTAHTTQQGAQTTFMHTQHCVSCAELSLLHLILR